MTYIVTYIGLPDAQYKDVEVDADNEEQARDEADSKLLAEYGRDNFDCIQVIQKPQ